MRLTASLSGLQAVHAQFARIAALPGRALDATAVQVEQYIDTQVAPHNKTHALERSLGKRRIPGGWEIGHDSRIAPYARFVHDGTRAHMIFPRNKKALRWVSGNAAFFGFKFSRGVHHPGTRPDRWLDRAAMMAPRIFQEMLHEIIERAQGGA